MYCFILKTSNNIGIEIRSWSIGPKHDPYQADQITISHDRGSNFVLYQDALGQAKFECEYSHGGTSNPWSWNCLPIDDAGKNVHKARMAYINDHAKATFGLTFDEAQTLAEEAQASAEPDPMGSLADYI